MEKNLTTTEFYISVARKLTYVININIYKYKGSR